MIISASRRTDIPNYYSDWFYNRIKEGFVYVRNPFNYRQITKISLSPDVTDGIVFWTKNPIPMLNRLEEIKNFPYYFQFTLNSYGGDIEPNVPPKNEIIIPAFIKLSEKIGRERIVWRYDPIFLTEKYNILYHTRKFAETAEKLAPYTDKCTISFLDLYRNIKSDVKAVNIRVPDNDEIFEIAEKFSEIAESFNLKIDTCAEKINLEKFGIGHARCVDAERFLKIAGYNLDVKKDKNQRAECGCAESVDIGLYNSCLNGCKYCYASRGASCLEINKQSDVSSPLLSGKVGFEDFVNERVVKSSRVTQINMFDK